MRIGGWWLVDDWWWITCLISTWPLPNLLFDVKLYVKPHNKRFVEWHHLYRMSISGFPIKQSTYSSLYMSRVASSCDMSHCHSTWGDISSDFNSLIQKSILLNLFTHQSIYRRNSLTKKYTKQCFKWTNCCLQVHMNSYNEIS